MRFTTAASVAALATVAYAQDPIVVSTLYCIYAGHMSSPHTCLLQINVGQGGLKFDPQFVDAPANSVVTFNFVGGNHSVSQSSFATPCEPVDGGFSSGFVPVGNNTGSWNLTITDDTKGTCRSRPRWPRRISLVQPCSDLVLLRAGPEPCCERQKGSL